MIKQKLCNLINFNYTKIISKINLKPKQLEIKNNEKLLCLAPHADDESIGMGGLLSAFNKNFDVVLLTDGRKGIKGMEIDEVILKREQEFKNAMDIAKVNKFLTLKIEDKKLIDNFEKFKQIDISNYDYIFIPNIIDQHPDHKAVSILLNKLLEISKYKSNLKICFYEVWSTLAIPNTFYDISDLIGTKKEMINCYESQMKDKDYIYHITGLNSYRGIFKDKKYVEAFMQLDVNDFKDVCKIYK